MRSLVTFALLQIVLHRLIFKSMKAVRYAYHQFVRCIASFLPRPHAATILMYHSVAKGDAFLSVSPEMFERQMKYLRDAQYDVVPLSELVRRMKAGESIERAVCVTFDDGYTDNLTVATPIMERYNIRGTLFVATGKIGGEFVTSDGDVMPMLDAVGVHTLETKAMEVMSHTYSHADLSLGSGEEAVRDAVHALDDLRAIGCAPGKVFAYPKGRFSAEVHDAIAANGAFEAAVTVQPGLVHLGDDLFTLSRNAVDSATSWPGFICALGRGSELSAMIKALWRPRR